MAHKLDEHLKQKGTFFCSVTHDLALAQEMIKTLPDFTSWAYIKHQPDSEDGTEHYHFLVRNNGTRSVQQIADKLGISGQYVQVCRKVVAFRRYMLHLDQDEKIKYTIDDIHTNRLPDFKSAIMGNDKRDVNVIFQDWKRLRSGEITSDEFIQLNWVDIQNMPFYQKIKTLELLDKYGGGPAPMTT